MPVNSNIFSIRIVTVDFYIQKPIPELDLCYSQFRAKEIKQVPVIRIFGSNSNGVKTCMNIHGVYPYFYVPYESKDLAEIETFSYQLAVSIDKAINITLGQAESEQQHVFKVQPVKGIPFYGFHRREHQYLKIYMYNPRFIKRAANLLQNGAISNKNFQPHESHVPFILQFLIDYNLYGMDFLRISESNLKYRKMNSDDDLLCNARSEQIITIDKNTISKLEIDINANYILNRFDLENKNSMNINPGIEAIWKDEKSRRTKVLELHSNEKLPPLKPPEFEERPEAEVTESEKFYYDALKKKLENIKKFNLTLNSSSMQSDETLSSQNETFKSKKGRISLSKFLANAVYPEECSQNNDNLLNASLIQNHSCDTNVILKSSNDCEKDLFDDSNSDLIFNISQNHDQSLINDNEVLEIMRQLEQEEEKEKGEYTKKSVDLDSTLAPLSQSESNLENPNNMVENKMISSDSENEDMNDLTILNEDIDNFLLKLSQPNVKNLNCSEMNLPQLDGGNDQCSTPRKRNSKIEANSPRKSTLKSRLSRYKPLEIVSRSPIKKDQSNLNGSLKKMKHNLNDDLNFISISSEDEYQRTNDKDIHSISSKKANLEAATLNSNTTLDSTKEDDVISISSTDSNIVKRRSSQQDSLNKTKTTITCNLKTPKSRSKRLRTELIPLEKDFNINTSQPDISNNNDIQKKEIYPEKQQKIIPDKYEGLIKNCKVKLKKMDLDGKESLSKSVLNNNLFIDVNNLKGNSSTDFVIQKDSDNSENNSNQSILKNSVKIVDLETTQSKSIDTEKILAKAKSPSKKLKLKAIEQHKNNISNHSNERPKRTCAKLTLARFTKNKRSNFKEEKPHKSGFERKKLKVLVKNLNNKEILKLIKESIPRDPYDRRRRSWSPSDVAREHDRKHNFFPEPGPSHIDYYSLIKLPSQHSNSITESGNILGVSRDKILAKSNDSITSENASPTPLLSQEKIKTKNSYSCLENLELISSDCPNTPESLNLLHKLLRNRYKEDKISPESDDDLNIVSFYDKSIICNDSPSLFSDLDSPGISLGANIKSLGNADTFIIRPKEYPPNYQEVFENMKKFQITTCKHPEPFYSNSADKTYLKEVGQNILSIPGNKLNDLEEYKSIVPNLLNLTSFRKGIIEAIIGSDYMKEFKTANQIKEYLCCEKNITVSTQLLPPTRKDAQLWLKARKLIEKKNALELKGLQIDDDSPIKIRRQKFVMMLENGMDDKSAKSLKSPSVSPLTVLSEENSSRELSGNNEVNLTPRSSKYRNINKLKLSFNEKLDLVEMAGAANTNKYQNIDQSIKFYKSQNDKTKPNIINNLKDLIVNSNESTKPGSQESDKTSTINSQDIENELERSSFKKALANSSNDCSFGLSGPSLNNTFGFKVNLENLQNAKADVEHTFLTVMSLEIFVSTRKNLKPNPEIDAIKCIFYTILNNVPETNKIPCKITGYIIYETKLEKLSKYTNLNGHLDLVQSELELINKLLDICKLNDPDILVGYEVEMNSWGYILERGKFLNMSLYQSLSRVPNQKVKQSKSNDEDAQPDSYMDLDIETKLCGRILLDVWRLLRSEIALTSYSFENVMYHILHRRCPLHTFQQLTEWYENDTTKWIVLEYYMERVNGTLELLEQLDLIGRTSEMAKLIGIQFYEVLSRGSQFRVESMMLRMAKPKNIIPLSPSVQQRAHMRAPEYLPLILEPQSRFYSDPLIVLDFQSLYPSVMIAYNYCFSTCLGRVEHLGQTAPFEFGASQLKVSNRILQKLIDEDNISISPCGAVFVKSEVREGVLPRMLREILDTRLMVKQSMKIHKSNSILQRVLHSRQLGLKLVANVTYGYTAANFSGRMPCVEVGDSVVAKGRECLERAIKLVESNDKWNVKVVYGDTDSLFVLCPGQSREDSFRIGAEIAEAVTNHNPYPIKLKLEKVYQPSILQTKKRYVGYMYESSDQKEPVYEAKGIETVRRDGCPAVAKMLEKCLRILFETCDISKIKEYVCRQFTKLLQGKANVQDLIFAKEFRGKCGYKPGACVPALELTKKWIKTDPRNEPRSGERVPYLIVNGPPGVPLIRLVRSPYEYLADPGLKINSIYYITKAIIPPLNRCLLLIGVDANEWFAELPRKALVIQLNSKDDELKKGDKKNTISQYFSSTNCVCDCGNQTIKNNLICESCKKNSTKSVIILENKISKLDRSYNLVHKICQSCCERFEKVNCSSLDCPVLYVKEAKLREFKQIPQMKQIINDNFMPPN